jgi:hypothetical protein
MSRKLERILFINYKLLLLLLWIILIIVLVFINVRHKKYFKLRLNLVIFFLTLFSVCAYKTPLDNGRKR